MSENDIDFLNLYRLPDVCKSLKEELAVEKKALSNAVNEINNLCDTFGIYTGDGTTLLTYSEYFFRELATKLLAEKELKTGTEYIEQLKSNINIKQKWVLDAPYGVIQIKKEEKLK